MRNPSRRRRTRIVTALRAAGCVFADDEADLLLGAASSPSELDAFLERRTAGEPLEQILGRVMFGGLEVVVQPGVFVPRRRSMLLARAAIEAARLGGTYLDLCTGSGAIAAVVGNRRTDLRILAADIDPRAVDCARVNLPGCWLGIGDLFEPVPDEVRGQIDVITVSAPYVPAAELPRLPREARDYEPAHTLLGGGDGLDVHRRVVRQVGGWLSGGGVAFLEVGEPQGAPLAELCRAAGLAAEVSHGAEGGHAVRASRG